MNTKTKTRHPSRQHFLLHHPHRPDIDSAQKSADGVLAFRSITPVNLLNL